MFHQHPQQFDQPRCQTALFAQAADALLLHIQTDRSDVQHILAFYGQQGTNPIEQFLHGEWQFKHHFCFHIKIGSLFAIHHQHHRHTLQRIMQRLANPLAAGAQRGSIHHHQIWIHGNQAFQRSGSVGRRFDLESLLCQTWTKGGTVNFLLFNQ
jgi:hypothetical protein